MRPEPRPANDPHDLLAHDAFVRGLAAQLVRDPDRAADVAQQTWVAALRRPPVGTAGHSVRAFLATIVRRMVGRARRDERREAARRELVAREPLVPSTAEILGREAQRAAVVRAVLALEPPYRDVVVLRFFEHLPPRAIAARLGLPVETVRTRLKRALAALRGTLDERPGGRAAWCALLLPYGRSLAPLTGAVAAKSLLLGVLGMSLQKAIVLAVAVVLVATAAWLTLAPTMAPERPTADAHAAAAPAAGAIAGARASEPSASPVNGDPATQRAAVTPPAQTQDGDAAVGGIAVKVVYEADETPVADAVVAVRRRDGEPMFDTLVGRTAADGWVRFARVPIGPYTPVVNRGNGSWGERVEVRAGEVVEATVKVEAGMDLQGRVVDGANRPMAGAEIVVSDWGASETFVLATTAADGTFALRSLFTHCHVGARAVGYAPSPLRQFTAGKGAVAEIVIVVDRPAVVVTGVVLDAVQRPVAGALVRAGDSNQRPMTLPDGGQALDWRPEEVVSDANGAFVLQHLPAGRVPVEAVARGFAPWRQELELANGRPEQLIVRLCRGARLVGTVRSADGPVARATVDLGTWDSLARRSVVTGPDGSFAIDGLAAGALEVRAAADEVGRARATLVASEGQEVRWDAVLTRGAVLKGRVVDEAGKGVASVMIEAMALRATRDDVWFAMQSSDDQGRFSLADCPQERDLQLSLRRQGVFPELVRDDVRWSAEELVIELPKPAWVHIQGTILDPDGRPLANVAVSPSQDRPGGAPAETADPATGAFGLGPYPPGAYQLRLSASGFPLLTMRRTLAPGETWDLGELRFARGGFVVLAPVFDDPKLIEGAEFEAVAANGDRSRFEAFGDRWRAGPLLAGTYRVRVCSEVVAAAALAFTVVEGQETVVDVPLRRGAAATLQVANAPATLERAIVEFAVRDATGELLGRPAAYVVDGRASVTFGLPVGTFTIEAVAPGFAGTARLQIDRIGAAATATIVLQAK